jgi:transcriptional regulator with XRE-family HTH domain
MLNKSDLRVLSAKIKQYRLAKKMTQPELSEKLGVPLGRVIDWESYGKKNYQVPNTTMLRALNDLFFPIQVEVPPKLSFMGRVRSFIKGL